MDEARYGAEIARSWAGYCSYNGETMTPGKRDSIISSMNSSSNVSSRSYGSGGYSSGRSNNDDAIRAIWNREFAAVSEYSVSSYSNGVWGSGYISPTYNPYSVRDVWNANRNAFVTTCHDPVTVPALKNTVFAVGTSGGLGSIKAWASLGQMGLGVAGEALNNQAGASTARLVSPSTTITFDTIFDGPLTRMFR